MVRWLMIVGMTVGMIPDNRNAGQGERGIVTSAHRIVPRTVVGLQLQVVTGDILFKPIAESGMGGCVEVDHMLRLFRLVVTSYHVKVEITLYLFKERTMLYEIFRAEQSLFFSVPKSEDDVSQWLLSAEDKRMCYL